MLLANQIVSLAGGTLMAVIGLFYLACEDFVLSDFSRANKAATHRSGRAVGRILTGAQVCLGVQ